MISAAIRTALATTSAHLSGPPEAQEGSDHSTARLTSESNPRKRCEGFYNHAVVEVELFFKHKEGSLSAVTGSQQYLVGMIANFLQRFFFGSFPTHILSLLASGGYYLPNAPAAGAHESTQASRQLPPVVGQHKHHFGNSMA